jgi:hypothetical protein
MGQPSYMKAEADKIEAVRKASPGMPAKKLAKQLEAAGGLGGRTFYSIYSVIRRYDAKQKALVTA